LEYRKPNKTTTPKQKATDLIKKFKDAQVKIKQSKEEAIASSILFVELLLNYSEVKDVEYWLEVKNALIDHN
jgi:hypothetical protein